MCVLATASPFNPPRYHVRPLRRAMIDRVGQVSPWSRRVFVQAASQTCQQVHGLIGKGTVALDERPQPGFENPRSNPVRDPRSWTTVAPDCERRWAWFHGATTLRVRARWRSEPRPGWPRSPQGRGAPLRTTASMTRDEDEVLVAACARIRCLRLHQPSGRFPASSKSGQQGLILTVGLATGPKLRPPPLSPAVANSVTATRRVAEPDEQPPPSCGSGANNLRHVLPLPTGH